MDKTSLINKIKKFGLNTKEEYMAEAFSRNIGLLTQAEQDKLANATVAIPGMGGVGGVHLITLTRTGVGKFHIADFDVFEPVNVNRQFGARVPDFGRPKMEVMKEQALSVNPYLEITEFPEGINNTNIDDFLNGVKVVLDGLDFFAFDARRLLFNRAREKGVYVITAGPLGFSSAMLIFSPHEGMSFDEYFNIVEGMAPQDQYLSFALGLAPRATHIKYMDLSRVDLESKAGPSLNIACQICSGMAATETIRIILKRKGLRPVPCFAQFDPYLMKLKKGRLFFGNRNPAQRAKMRVANYLLEKNKKTKSPQIPIPSSAGIKSGYIPKEVLNYIVTMGTWAPSADNCQPWQFVWDGQYLKLFKSPEKSGFFYDINQESTYITFGAVIENIAIAASHFGIETECQYYPGNTHYNNQIAQLSFSLIQKKEDPLFPHLFERCVNRMPYKKERTDKNIIQDLKVAASNPFGASLWWIDDEKSRKVFHRIVFNADRILFEDKRLHEGLFRWINFKNGIKKDGMDVDALGLSFGQKIAFPLMKSWPLVEFMNKFGVSRIAALNSVNLLKKSSAYCLLTIDGNTFEDYINAGRAMERFWIKANSIGLCLQPMAGFIFLLNHYAFNKSILFSKCHRTLIEQMSMDLNKLINFTKDWHPVMFFRIGRSKRFSARTQRNDDSIPK